MDEVLNLSLTPVQVRVLFAVLSERSVSVLSKLQKFQCIDSIKDGLYKDWTLEYKCLDDVIHQLISGLSLED